jgi:hypothetical protein
VAVGAGAAEAVSEGGGGGSIVSSCEIGAASKVETGAAAVVGGGSEPFIFMITTPALPRSNIATITAYFLFGDDGGIPAGSRIDGGGTLLGLIFEGDLSISKAASTSTTRRECV